MSKPLGQASRCISFCKEIEASSWLGILCCWIVASSSCSHILPEVMCSVAWRIWMWKYEEGWASYRGSCIDVNSVELSVGGVAGGVGSSNRRKACPDSQLEACNSDTDMGRVPISAGLSLVGMYLH